MVPAQHIQLMGLMDSRSFIEIIYMGQLQFILTTSVPYFDVVDINYLNYN